ncbi:Y9955-like protein [Mya arenaria]|uniref:Y9955-like protein n=1 Tax=Mya arenaria TaxID=6604 RepID=A0ABY7FCA2_MYAAR|nr:uncharacterized protein LOC128209265 [Mya arenaria]WAR19725.1 Y9955-like protein [Mya arenaria]
MSDKEKKTPSRKPVSKHVDQKSRSDRDVNWGRQASGHTDGRKDGRPLENLTRKPHTVSLDARRTPAPRPRIVGNAPAQLTGQRSAPAKTTTDLNLKFEHGARIKREPDAKVVGRTIARDDDKGRKGTQPDVVPTKPLVYNVYKDTPQNRKLNRVGLPLGSAQYSAETGRITAVQYVDSPINRKLNRVGLPRGSVPVTNKSTETVAIPKMMEKIFNGDEMDSFSSNRDIRVDIPGISEDTYKVAFEQALYRINRQKEELDWLKSKKSFENQNLTGMSFFKGRLPYKELDLRSQIGEGNFGDVFFGEWMGSVLAIKKLREKMTNKRLKDFSKEMDLICGTSHPNIVRYMGYCDERPDICIVMEYMSMTLYDALHLRHDIDFNNKERLQIIQQMCEGMKYLHSKDMPHADLKPKNVLLNYKKGKECVAKLSDFGLRQVKINVDTTSSAAGAKITHKSAIPRYSAPEVLSGEILKIPDMMKADIWSLALLLHEVLYDEEPYFDMSYKTLLQEVGAKGVTPKGPSDVRIDHTVSVTQKRALSLNPADRPDITYMCGILKEIDSIYKEYA